jgi:ankyrin repeat protein
MAPNRSIQDRDWEVTQPLLDFDGLVEATISRNDDVRLKFTKRDAVGATLFHYACSKNQISVDLISTIIDRIGPKSHATDKDGNSAIHYAAALGSSKVLGVLLQRLPLAARIGGQHQPCKLAWLGYFQVQSGEHDSGALKKRIRHLVRANRLKSLVEFPPLKELWNKTVLLCSHLLQKTMRHSREPPPHTVNAVSSLVCFGGMDSLDCPTISVWMALQITRDYDLLEPDEDGNLLLHRAAASAPLSTLTLSSKVEAYMERKASGEWNWFAHRSVIAQLCHLEPDAATVRNRNGQLPLHVAIDNGKSWNDGVEDLLNAYPNSIDIPDPVSGLPPLLLSGCSNLDLSTIFEIARNHTNVVYFEPDDDI